MLTAYYPIAVLITIAVLLGVVAIALGHLVGPRRPSKQKSAPYESGMPPIGPGTRQMPVRFYIVAVLFILFDIEIIFLIPWAVIFRELGIFGLIEIIVFVIILLVGFVYAWKKGAFEWE
jgi:NADH-quinone oxidoreductase subunit A